ncbi:MAG: polysaccharide deacetylase family protein [Aquificae bacterium]|nr:polysaccharide deacetylase family protein [Aquificota bacterium]
MEKAKNSEIKLVVALLLSGVIGVVVFWSGKTFKKDREEFFLYKKYVPYLDKKGENLIKKFVFKADTDEKIVVLTFDDGPAENGKGLVKVLEKYQVPATFFLVAEKISPQNINRYRSDLFTIGMHTYSHSNYDRLTEEEIQKDVAKTVEVFKNFNINTSYFRPAYGIVNEGLEKALDRFSLQGILWSLDPMDWKISNQEEIIKNITENLSPGSIILLHENRIKPQTLETVIKKLKEKGYRIVPLEKLLTYPVEHPKLLAGKKTLFLREKGQKEKEDGGYN